ncbi:MAG: ABC transporter substrate-binding protein [Oceanospirillaceae bacterium]|nr:ABC transporter substrate-binding protein [Oceanospirillaceae bacterium]
MNKKLRSLALTVSLLALPTVDAQAAQRDSIRIGTEGAYPPFNYFTANGELSGFDVDIGKALCAKLEAECSFVAQDWDGIIPALVAGKYDVVIASMFITDERRQQVDFTLPYQKSAMTFVVPKGSTLTDFSPQALAGKSLGAQSSTTQAEFLARHYPGSDVRLYPSQEALNLDMLSGRLDAQVADIVPMLEWTGKTDDGACCRLAGELITDPRFVGEGVGMALRQDDDELRERLNRALTEIVADGTYKAINDKYFDINILTLE